jgi:hypothetical protein
VDRLRHLFRWLPNGWWPWVGVPCLVILVVLRAADGAPWALPIVVVLPVSVWVGFRRHEARVRSWRRSPS